MLVAVYVCCGTSSLVSDVARPTDTKLGYRNPKVVLSLPLLAPLKTMYFQVRSLPPASPRSRMSAVSFPCTVGKIPTQIRDGSPHLHAGVGIFGQLTKLHRAKIASTARTAPPGLPAGQWARLAAGFLFHTTLSSSSTGWYRSAGKAWLANGGPRVAAPNAGPEVNPGRRRYALRRWHDSISLRLYIVRV